jgi:hypothetical protein
MMFTRGFSALGSKENCGERQAPLAPTNVRQTEKELRAGSLDFGALSGKQAV